MDKYALILDTDQLSCEFSFPVQFIIHLVILIMNCNLQYLLADIDEMC
jgi:hypothetical protein